MNKKVAVQELGIKDYKDTWDFQEEIFQEIVQQKSKNRKEQTQVPTHNYFLYV